MNADKTVLITGAAGGLGRVIAAQFAAAGYSLAIHVRADDERSADLLKQIPPSSKVKFFRADLLDENSIAAMASEIRSAFGTIYAVINIAGIPFSGMSWKQELQDWDLVMNTNARAPWLVSKHMIPLLRDNGSGRIIYTSSIVAHRPLAGTSAYAASKSALEGLTRAQAVELSRFGITVNCIAPGYFDAGMISSVPAEQQEQLKTATPAGRLGHADELAAHLLYLCSSQAGFITGQVHHINGGLYI